jgi:hypothetical protein
LTHDGGSTTAGDEAAILSVLLDAAPVGFAYYDRERRYVHINDSLAAANGRTPAEHVGRTIREIVPEVAVHAEPLIDQVLDTGEPCCSSCRPVPAGRRPTFWRTGWYPVASQVDGTCSGVAVVATDITTWWRPASPLQQTALTLQSLAAADDSPVHRGAGVARRVLGRRRGHRGRRVLVRRHRAGAGGWPW